MSNTATNSKTSFEVVDVIRLTANAEMFGTPCVTMTRFEAEKLAAMLKNSGPESFVISIESGDHAL